MTNNYVSLVILLLVSSTISCSQEELVGDTVIYSNNFEDSDLTNITGGKILSFNNSNVIGNYNNDGFRLNLMDIPDHQYVHISFDLLLHDSWDGNTNGLEPDAPDLWIMELNQGLNLQRVDNPKFETTFANGPCDSQLCLYQSFPNPYPFLAPPKTGISYFASGFCHFQSSETGTMVINIQKTYSHSDRALVIDFYDKLFQSNVTDPKCDESWSLDNLEVRALTVR